MSKSKLITPKTEFLNLKNHFVLKECELVPKHAPGKLKHQDKCGFLNIGILIIAILVIDILLIAILVIDILLIDILFINNYIFESA